jgi:hypothetical protein
MEQNFTKKIIGTTVFAVAIAVTAFSLFSVASAVSENASATGQGHAYGHAYGQPDTPPPGQVGNTNSNRAGTPGNGRGK